MIIYRLAEFQCPLCNELIDPFIPKKELVNFPDLTISKPGSSIDCYKCKENILVPENTPIQSLNIKAQSKNDDPHIDNQLRKTSIINTPKSIFFGKIFSLFLGLLVIGGVYLFLIFLDRIVLIN